MKKKVYFYNKEREKLVGILHKPKKKSNIGVIICHGFTGSKDRNFIQILSKRLSKNYNVLRFDFSGNGESEGKFEDQCYSKYVEELKKAIDLMKKENKQIIVIGHSFGSNIIVLEYEKYKNIDKIITIAPGFFLVRKRILNLVLGFIISLISGKENFIDSWGEKRSLKLRFFLERMKYNIKNAIKKIDTPLLIILAGDDRVINNKKSKQFFKKNRIDYTEIINAKHGFAKEKYLNQVAKETLKWLK